MTPLVKFNTAIIYPICCDATVRAFAVSIGTSFFYLYSRKTGMPRIRETAIPNYKNSMYWRKREKHLLSTTGNLAALNASLLFK